MGRRLAPGAPSTHAQSPVQSRPGGVQAFSSLRYMDFRYLWLGQFGHSLSMWMEAVARNWLIWQMTESGLWLGLVNLARAIPLIVFGLLSGVAADRFDRKRILFHTQWVTMVLKLLMGVLITTGQVQVWHVVLLAFLTGVSMAFNQPARTALVPDTVPRQDLMNAVALNQLAMNAPRFIGPALAGVVIAAAGVDVSYYVAGAAYGPVLLFTLLMEVPSRGTARNPERTLWSELGDGFRYVAGRRIVLVLLALSLVPTVFGLSFLAILPMFADRVLNAGPGGYGLLLSVFGVGAIAGGVVVASLGDFRFKGWFLLGTAFLFGVFLSGMAVAPWFPVTIAFLLLIGATGTLYRPVNNALLLTLTPPELHGRVMSMFLLDRGLMPLGSVLAGALADLANVSVAMAVLGALCAGLVALAAVVEPRVRSL